MLQHLSENATAIEGQIDTLLDEINNLNISLTTVVPDKLMETADNYGSNVTRHVEIFTDWLNVQVKQNIGACQVCTL